MSSRSLWVPVAAVALLAGCEDERTDIVVYGKTEPPASFENPYTSVPFAGGPVTTSVIRASGVHNPLGTTSWGIATFGKYILLGNYDKRGAGVFQHIEDQRVGVFDSEQKAFCQLDLDPGAARNAGVEWLAVATPNQRTTRVYFEGIAPPRTGGFVFGFFSASLDTADPCDPVSGWTPHGITAGELNAKARLAHQPDACPDDTPQDLSNDACGFDGMALLHHDPVTGTDWVLLGNWINERMVVAKIDSVGNLEVPVVHVLPYWRHTPAAPSPIPDACWRLLPVGPAAVDPTRPASDRRFLQAFDKFCAPAGAAGCPAKPLCPLSGTACTGSCEAYCSLPGIFVGYEPAPAPNDPRQCNGQPVSCSNYLLDLGVATLCLNLGQPTTGCLAAHPATVCKAGGDCSCPSGSPSPPTPAREYSFDTTTAQLRATSRFVLPNSTEGFVAFGDSYSTSGAVHVATFNTSPASRILRFPRLANGEHAFFDAATTLDSGAEAIFDGSPALPFPLKNSWFSAATAGVEVGSAMHILGKSLMKRWFQIGQDFDPNYNVAFGVGEGIATLPQSGAYCDVPTPTACPAEGCPAGLVCAPQTDCANPLGTPSICRPPQHLPCSSDSDCASGLICRPGNGPGELPPPNMMLGGSPRSLWFSPHYGCAETDDIAAYLTQIPVPVELPGDSRSAMPPSAAWSTLPSCGSSRCSRLWLFAAPGGTLGYRTRDQGLWSAAYAPLPGNVSIQGGVAAVFAGTQADLSDFTVEIYGRRQSDGALHRSVLTSPLDCNTTGRPSCAWSPWQAVSGAPATNTEPAVTVARIDGAAVVFAAVKDAAGALHVARRTTAGWSSWQPVPSLVANSAPSLVFKADDEQVWLFARESGSNAIRYARVNPQAPSGWTTVGAGTTFRTGPTASYTGIVRVLAGRQTDAATLQITFAGGAWDDWKPAMAGGTTVFPPAAAVVGSDLDAFTTVFPGNLYEQLVR